MPRKTLSGTVLKVIDAATVSVNVKNTTSHPIYKKVVHEVKKYLVHTPGGGKPTLLVGQKVIIEECRPISKRKNWSLKEVIA